ncbi:hypothetical protein AQ932_12620 [Burkholderia pseudomallei]|nr:hypothetical protein [Burkholderia pseudomallei]OMZ79297.1 hypothetical protein AQ870_17690 [Burkholderia pseudomallei]OND29464.1 hypothetical protein AQ931_16220 [Burkholderia pseudomallei]OND40171.1 hypothetical protein AQ933_30710 [Burkholderia pseudomallei]OND51198.1 hypothetical protein AQ932_12620 [Burkholderia pseudomallei]
MRTRAERTTKHTGVEATPARHPASAAAAVVAPRVAPLRHSNCQAPAVNRDGER